MIELIQKMMQVGRRTHINCKKLYESCLYGCKKLYESCLYPVGATWAIYVVITDQNFVVKGCPFQHRPRPARDVKRVSISLFFLKRVPFYNGYVGVLGSDFEKSSRKSSMTDVGQHVFTITPSYFLLVSYLVSHQD